MLLRIRDYLVTGPFEKLKKYEPQDWNEIVVVMTHHEAGRGQMEYKNIRIKEAM